MSTQANLCDYLERSRLAHPDRTAVVDPSGLRLTYRELDERACRIAGFLAAKGVQPGDRVGIIAPKSADVVATLFGAMKAGAAYVPADYSAPVARNQTLLVDCAVKALFLDPSCAAIAETWPTPAAPEIVWFDGPDQSAPSPPGTPFAVASGNAPLTEKRQVDAQGLAYILYTSGSTGKPKGVTLTQENATSFVDWCSDVFQPNPEDRFSSHAPFHFDLSILDLYVPIKHGAALYLVSETVGKSPEDLATFISSNQLTVWYSTPSILSLIAQFGRLDQHDCSTLRLALFAGEVFPVKHLRNIVERWPQAIFYNLYGPTETNVCTLARIPGAIPPERTEPYPIGPLCGHCEGVVLDTPGGKEVGRGDEGLLHIAGPSLFQGYWNRVDDDLFVERGGKRYYNTGDVVRETADEGYIYVGRRDRMVKRRGYRIELGEIERGLYQNDKLREAAVISLPDSGAGVRIIAVVAPQPGHHPSIIELKTFCGQALPAYMNPDAFVVVEALPRTSTNKVDYQGLIRLAEPQRSPSEAGKATNAQ
jgi:amino acid adenylation domain-containing protein